MSDYWISVQEHLLCTRQWGDEYVLYHIQSGDTHMLDEAGFSIISFLKNKAANLEEILQYLRDIKSYDIQAVQLEELLANMVRSDLIKYAS